ncbi:MAG: hypothetical protein CMH56_01980 [Myxococcales bacterium]|mgnify:CR=1 FL=1|nr:hypothetical protein [Myxococcales bacterium]
MRIASKALPLGTLRYLDKANAKVRKNATKMGQGQRITKAADDASGLAMSEKLRSRIRGYQQTQKNIQDGMNLLATAEQGLGSLIDNQLMRLKTLSVQAANGALEDSDRQAIQAEVEEILASITKTSETLSFNGKPLLDDHPSDKTMIPESFIDIVFTFDTSGSMNADLTALANNISTFTDNLNSNNVNWRLAAGGAAGNGLRYSDFTSDVAQFQADVLTLAGGGTIAGQRYGPPPNDAHQAFESVTTAAASYPWRANAARRIIHLTDDDQAINGFVPAEVAQGTALAAALAATDTVVDIMGCAPSGVPDAYEELVTLPNGTGGTYHAYATNTGVFSEPALVAALGNAASEATLQAAPVPVADIFDYTLQTGVAEGDTSIITVFDGRLSNLGLESLDVSTLQTAQQAISSVDGAIVTAAGGRANMGAQYNRLEHTLQHAMNEMIQATASESRIRDLDIAQGAAELAKGSILQEIALSLMAQINQNRQIALKLLT